MTSPRLSLLLESGAVSLPAEGRIAVIGPRAGSDLGALPKPRVHVIQGFRPDHDAFGADGYATATAPEGGYAAAVVFLPRSRALARSEIATALRLARGGPVLVDGQKTDGIDGILRDVRAHMPVAEVLSKAHGKIFVIPADHLELPDWEEHAGPRTVGAGWLTSPGAFSADGPDPGSHALAAALPAGLAGRVADLGAGWGFLARAILERPGVVEVHLIEADHASLLLSRENVDDPRAQFHWADAMAFKPEAPFDAVVTNPPFHSGRAADPGIGRAFIAAAAAMLKPSGQLWLVANRHLPYEAALAAAFADVTEADGTAAFKVIRAAKPRRPSQRPSAQTRRDP